MLAAAFEPATAIPDGALFESGARLHESDVVRARLAAHGCEEDVALQAGRAVLALEGDGDGLGDVGGHVEAVSGRVCKHVDIILGEVI